MKVYLQYLDRQRRRKGEKGDVEDKAYRLEQEDVFLRLFYFSLINQIQSKIECPAIKGFKFSSETLQSYAKLLTVVCLKPCKVTLSC